LYEKYEHHSKIYTGGSKKDEKVGYAVVSSESKIKRRQFPQNSIYSAEQSAIINVIYSTANYNQKQVIITDSLSTIIAVCDRKRSKNPKTQLIRKLIDQASTNITLL
jgi:archaellum biogenesis ATPase FlaH